MATQLYLDKDLSEAGLIANIESASDISRSLKKILVKIVKDPNVLNSNENIKAYAKLIIRDINANRVQFPVEQAVLAVMADMPIIYEHNPNSEDKCISDLLEGVIARVFGFDMEREYKIINNLRL